jgi:hypothetical protein
MCRVTRVSFVWLILLGIGLPAALLTGCEKGLKKDRYLAFLAQPQNGLHQVVIGEWFTYRLQFQPADALALREMEDQPFSPETFERTKEQFSGHRYFLVSIQPNKTSKSIQETLSEAAQEAKAGERIWQTLQFGLEPYVKLSCGKDTMPCVLFHAQPPLMKNGQMQLHFVFLEEPSNNSVRNEDLRITFSIPEFPEPIPSFYVRRHDLTQIPTLNF